MTVLTQNSIIEVQVNIRYVTMFILDKMWVLWYAAERQLQLLHSFSR